MIYNNLLPILIITFILSGVNEAIASKVSIPLEDKEFTQMPASDLVYNGSRIDEVDALELQKSGIDISTLNPYQDNNLWQDHKLNSNNSDELRYPKSTGLVTFKSFKKSPSEIFRAIVTDKNNHEFTLTASLDNHTNILRAGLLRLLGYDIDTPRYYQELTVKFESNEERDKFLELVGEQTLTKRDKWVVSKKENEITLKGITIEPAKLRNVNIHLPLMGRDRQQERRIFRALLDVYVLTDFPQQINKIGWQTGRVFNNTLIFNHPYAREFKDVTVDDLKWIHRRIQNLNENEIREAVELSGYPEDISALVFEKLLSRINHMSELLGLEMPFSPNTMVTIGNVVGGKLTSGDYQGYVVDFYAEDPLSPYRFGEIFRLFKTQITYSALSSALDWVTSKIIPSKGIDDAISSIQEKIADFKQDNSTGVLPVKMWSAPIATGRVFANRNIIFGQYLGMRSPIQLVDSVGAEVSLGIFSGITGLSQTIMPTLNTSASIGRTYIHVRAMPDLKSASKQKISKVIVPHLMKKLGRVIKDEFECSIPLEAWVDEGEISGEKIYYIKYDKDRTNGKEEAIEKRKELIESGVDESKILLVKIDRNSLCKDEISKTRSENLDTFLKQFAMNESFIINDTLRVGTRPNVNIPLTGLTGASLSFGAEASVGLLRSILLRRTEEGIEVTLQQQRNIKASLSEGLNYFIEIIRNTTEIKKGRLFSKVYKIKLDNINDEQKIIALKTIREILVDSDHDLMQENYIPYDLDHNVLTKLNTFRILFYKSEKLKMDHNVDIIVPLKPGETFSEEERTRSFYSHITMKRKSIDVFGFFDRAVSSLTGFFGFGSNDGDPGQNFMGRSTKQYITTESELTPNFPLNALTRIEYIYSGWKVRKWKLKKILNEIENMLPKVKHGLFDRTQFHGVKNFRSYDIRATIILYPDAFKKIQRHIFEVNENKAINALYALIGENEWREECYDLEDFFGNRGPQNYYGENYYQCIPIEAQMILDLRKKKLPSDRRKLTQKINKIFQTFMEEFDRRRFLNWIGKDNFFASTRITGFRENHHEGHIEYISDTIGTYNTTIGTGVYDQVSSYFGLSPYELRALNYTPGM